MVAKKARNLLLIAIANLLFFAVCLELTTWQNADQYDIKMAAVGKAIVAQKVIGSQLIGEEYTPITTTLGTYDAKVLSANPEFAAVAVELLSSGGIKRGDTVAMNMSSSFPALNIAAIAAVDALGAKPIIVSSVGASTWGANRPDFTWLDMEKELVDNGVWPWRSSAAGIGGGSDQGYGLSPEGMAVINSAIQRTGIRPVGGTTLSEAIECRLSLYKKENQGYLPKVLVNVGGNHVIFGEHGHDAFLREGLTIGYRPSLAMSEGLAAEFIKNNRSVIHFINIQRLAARYNIHAGSQVGESTVFHSIRIPIYLRIIIIFWIIGMLFLIWQGKQKSWWKV